MSCNIVYYCWFGEYIKSEEIKNRILKWKKLLYDREFVEINESNFNINEYQYAKDAYRLGKYAFVSDCARVHFLNKYGGIYIDTDVDLLKDPTPLFKNDILFSQEKYYFEITGVNTSLIISNNNLHIWKELLYFYKYNNFKENEIKTINQYLNNLLLLNTSYLKNKDKVQQLIYKGNTIDIIPSKYLMRNSNRAYAIHNMNNSWNKNLTNYYVARRIIGQIIKKILGENLFNLLWKR